MANAIASRSLCSDIGKGPLTNAVEPGIDFHRARHMAIGMDGEQRANAAIAKGIRRIHAVRRQMLTKGQAEEMLCLAILHGRDGPPKPHQMQELPRIKEFAVARETVQEWPLIRPALHRDRARRREGTLSGLQGADGTRGLVIAAAILLGGRLEVPADPCRGLDKIFLRKEVTT